MTHLPTQSEQTVSSGHLVGLTNFLYQKPGRSDSLVIFLLSSNPMVRCSYREAPLPLWLLVTCWCWARREPCISLVWKGQDMQGQPVSWLTYWMSTRWSEMGGVLTTLPNVSWVPECYAARHFLSSGWEHRGISSVLLLHVRYLSVIFPESKWGWHKN